MCVAIVLLKFDVIFSPSCMLCNYKSFSITVTIWNTTTITIIVGDLYIKDI